MRTRLARHTHRDQPQRSQPPRPRHHRPVFEPFRQAFTDRHIELGHLNAATTILPTELTGTERDLAIELIASWQQRLIDVATDTTIDQFTRFCRELRAKLTINGDSDPSTDTSTAWTARTFQNRWVLNADLSADDGAQLETLLTERMQLIRTRLTNEHAQHTNNADDADRADGVDRVDGADGQVVLPTQRQLRAMALMELVLDGAGAKQPGRVGLYLHINLEDLNTEPTEHDLFTGANAHTEADLDITDTTLWNLLADADITPVFNHNGQPLCYGRTRRFAPPILRRVLAHRDRHCVWPGCTTPANRTHTHHLHTWANGGTTDPNNTAGVCPTDHHHLHTNDFTTTRNADGTLNTTRPDGTPIPTTPNYRTPTRFERYAHQRQHDHEQPPAPDEHETHHAKTPPRPPRAPAKMGPTRPTSTSTSTPSTWGPTRPVT
ncbi:MAG: DUF222 domain-containing protein [Actinobacteria bacterium]|nr:DUF222 domain-containing protein [Actinomycetota bacterium]